VSAPSEPGLGLDPAILPLLACPCPRHATLQIDEDIERLICSSCGSGFPVRDGVAILLLDEAIPGPSGVPGA